MEEFFHSAGKIWVVVAVIAVIFVGLLIFLMGMERKLNRLERRIDEQEGGSGGSQDGSS